MMKRMMLGGMAVMALLALLVAAFGPGALRAYAIGRIESAKREGVYASPQEGMRAGIVSLYRDIQRIEIDHAGTNSTDGRLPHVWFVTARVYAAARGDGKPIPAGEYDLPGSYFLRVDDGWVHVPEGAFPVVIGRAMQRFGLYGCDAAKRNCG